MRTWLAPLIASAALLGCAPALAAADRDQLEVRIICLDLADGALDRLGCDRTNGHLPSRLPIAAILILLDPEQAEVVASARVRTKPGQPGSDDRRHRATYLEPTPGGRLEQRDSELDEGIAVTLTPMVDSEGRIRIDGHLTLATINRRAAISGLDRVALGRPLESATREIDPAVSLRLGEAAVIPCPGGAVGRERVLLVAVAPAP